jgi:hypothetical protein
MTILLSTTSCKKEDNNDPDPNPNPQTGDGVMTANVDGNDFNADQNATAIYEMGSLVISGHSADAQIQITIWNPDHVTGDFPLTSDGSEGTFGIYVHSTDIYQNYYSHVGDNTGMIVLNEFTDTRVKGTFNFTAGNISGDQILISEGYFDARLIDIDFEVQSGNFPRK